MANILMKKAIARGKIIEIMPIRRLGMFNKVCAQMLTVLYCRRGPAGPYQRTDFMQLVEEVGSCSERRK